MREKILKEKPSVSWFISIDRLKPKSIYFTFTNSSSFSLWSHYYGLSCLDQWRILKKNIYCIFKLMKQGVRKKDCVIWNIFAFIKDRSAHEVKAHLVLTSKHSSSKKKNSIFYGTSYNFSFLFYYSICSTLDNISETKISIFIFLLAEYKNSKNVHIFLINFTVNLGNINIWLAVHVMCFKYFCTFIFTLKCSFSVIYFIHWTISRKMKK